MTCSRCLPPFRERSPRILGIPALMAGLMRCFTVSLERCRRGWARAWTLKARQQHQQHMRNPPASQGTPSYLAEMSTARLCQGNPKNCSLQMLAISLVVVVSHNGLRIRSSDPAFQHLRRVKSLVESGPRFWPRMCVLKLIPIWRTSSM